jgi:transcriptional regulator with XRE-family HTH domain
MSSHPLTVFRKSRGLSRAALAQFLGTSRANVTRWEKDNRKPSRDWLRLITKKTGIPPWELRPDLVEMIGSGDRR